jgi:hypothetical protein
MSTEPVNPASAPDFAGTYHSFEDMAGGNSTNTLILAADGTYQYQSVSEGEGHPVLEPDGTWGFEHDPLQTFDSSGTWTYDGDTDPPQINLETVPVSSGGPFMSLTVQEGQLISGAGYQDTSDDGPGPDRHVFTREGP